MKKMILTMSAVLMFGAFADAELSSDVLMWYIDLGDTDEALGIRNVEFNTLDFFLRSTVDPSQTIDLTGFTHLYTSDGASPVAGTASGIHGDAGFAGVYVTDLSGAGVIDWTTYEFMMTLKNGGDLVAWSSALFNPLTEDHVLLSSLETAKALYNRAEGGDLNPTAMPENFAPYSFGPHVVPEPTSGLLMLVGGALLALRRRRGC